MNKIFVIIIGVVVVLGSWFWLRENRSESKMPENNSINKEMNAGTLTKESMGEVKTFQIDSSNFKYSMGEIKVKKGDRVKIILNVKEGFHDIVLDEFKVASEKKKAGEMTEVEFVADKEGKFEYYCSVGTHRQMGMFGTLIVE